MLVYSVGGAVMAAIAIPMVQRRIPPNPFYGFRVPKSLKNPVVWYEINAYSGRRLLVVGLVVAIIAPLLYLIPGLDIDTYAVIIAGVLGVGLTIALVWSFIYLNQL
jgi:uncharacterized membrane protein